MRTNQTGHIIFWKKAEKMKIVPCLFHFRGLEKLGFESDTNPFHSPDYKMFLSNGSRTTSLRKLNLYVFTFTFLDCLSGGSLTTSRTTGWVERSSLEAQCPLTHSFSISRSACECELRKWKWFSSMTKCVWNLYHIHIMDGSESINCAGRSQNRAFMGGLRRAVCKVNKVKIGSQNWWCLLRTSDCWLERMDRNEAQLKPVLQATYGEKWQRW